MNVREVIADSTRKEREYTAQLKVLSDGQNRMCSLLEKCLATPGENGASQATVKVTKILKKPESADRRHMDDPRFQALMSQDD